MADILRLLLGVCLIYASVVESYHDDDGDNIDLRPGLPVKCYHAPDMQHTCTGTVTFRWYYDKYSDSCKVFPYRGCHDHGNNFNTRDHCINQCIKSSVKRNDYQRLYRLPEGKSAILTQYDYTPEIIPESRGGGKRSRPYYHHTQGSPHSGGYSDSSLRYKYGGPDHRSPAPRSHRRGQPSPLQAGGINYHTSTVSPAGPYTRERRYTPNNPTDYYHNDNNQYNNDDLYDNNDHYDNNNEGYDNNNEGYDKNDHYDNRDNDHFDNNDYDSPDNGPDSSRYDSIDRYDSRPQTAPISGRRLRKKPYWEPAYIKEEPYRSKPSYTDYEKHHPFYKDKEVERPRYFQPYNEQSGKTIYPRVGEGEEERYNHQSGEVRGQYTARRSSERPAPPPGPYTDRHTDRHTPRHTDRYNMDRQTDRHRYRPDDRFSHDDSYEPADSYESSESYESYPDEFDGNHDSSISELDPVNLYNEQLRRVEQGREVTKNKAFYHYEAPEHQPSGPTDEYYYGRHKSRPKNIPPNRYIFGEGPVHPQEVPREIQEFDPNTNTEEVYPVTEEYDTPEDGAGAGEKEQPFVNEMGHAPRPQHGAFPGIPTNPALRRFRLRSGWVIEIIDGGFRAIKDETELNGWKHVYARIYREAPDGSAGRSIWMFQSEYESPKETEEDRAPPPEYLQHVGRQANRRKRAVLNYPPLTLLPPGKARFSTRVSPQGSALTSPRLSPRLLTSPRLSPRLLLSSLLSLSAGIPRPPPPNHWSPPDSLDHLYGEPNIKPNGEIPFVNNLDTEEVGGHDVPPPHQGAGPYRGQRPLVNHRQFMTRPSLQQLPHRHPYQEPSHQQRHQPELQEQTQEPQEQTQAQETPQDEKKPVEGKSGPRLNPNDFMSDSDIFDSLPNLNLVDNKEAKETTKPSDQPEVKKPKQSSDFMTDSDIFDGLPTIPKQSDNAETEGEKEEEIEQEKNEATEGAQREYDMTDGDLDDGGMYTDTESTPQCLQFPETGSCRAYIRRWYYDPRKGECFTFIYGGCDGNQNSFNTKEECLHTCSNSEPQIEEKKEEKEEVKPEPKSHDYLGLRRNKPSGEMREEESFQPEPHEDIDEYDQEQESREEEQEEQENKVPVINHFYTYHNYGPYHSKHHTFNTATYSDSSESGPRGSAESSSEQEEQSEEEPREDQREEEPREEQREEEHEEEPVHPFGGESTEEAHDKHVSNLISPFPSPLKFFFKILKKMRPRNSLSIMRRPVGDKPIIQSFHRKTNDGGVSFIRLMYSKKPRNMDQVLPRRNMLDQAPPRRNMDEFPPRRNMDEFPPRRNMVEFTPLRNMNRPPMRHPPPPPPQQPRPVYPDARQAPPHHQYNHPPPPPQRKPFPNLKLLNLKTPSFKPQDQLMMDPLFNGGPNKKSPFSMFPLMPLLFAQQHKAAGMKPHHGEPNLACRQPRDEGNCPPRIGMPRWYYDQERGICDIFFYNGCGGTLNRFDSFEQCRSICMVQSPAPPVDMQPKPPKEDKPAEQVKEEKKEKKTIEVNEIPEEAPVLGGYDLAYMHMSSRTEFIMVIVIMILGGTSLIALIAITGCYTYKKYKLAKRVAKETTLERTIQAHAYPEVHKISVIELPGNQVAGVHAIKQI